MNLRIVQVSASKIASTEEELDRYTREAMRLETALRSKGWGVMVENVDEYEGPARG